MYHAVNKVCLVTFAEFYTATDSFESTIGTTSPTITQTSSVITTQRGDTESISTTSIPFVSTSKDVPSTTPELTPSHKRTTETESISTSVPVLSTTKEVPLTTPKLTSPHKKTTETAKKVHKATTIPTLAPDEEITETEFYTVTDSFESTIVTTSPTITQTSSVITTQRGDTESISTTSIPFVSTTRDIPSTTPELTPSHKRTTETESISTSVPVLSTTKEVPLTTPKLTSPHKKTTETGNNSSGYINWLLMTSYLQILLTDFVVQHSTITQTSSVITTQRGDTESISTTSIPFVSTTRDVPSTTSELTPSHKRTTETESISTSVPVLSTTKEVPLTTPKLTSPHKKTTETAKKVHTATTIPTLAPDEEITETEFYTATDSFESHDWNNESYIHTNIVGHYNSAGRYKSISTTSIPFVSTTRDVPSTTPELTPSHKRTTETESISTSVPVLSTTKEVPLTTPKLTSPHKKTTETAKKVHTATTITTLAPDEEITETEFYTATDSFESTIGTTSTTITQTSSVITTQRGDTESISTTSIPFVSTIRDVPSTTPELTPSHKRTTETESISMSVPVLSTTKEVPLTTPKLTSSHKKTTETAKKVHTATTIPTLAPDEEITETG
ncbi:uncharacterized protein LOC102801589 [Saccoglossus kowalevskii]